MSAVSNRPRFKHQVPWSQAELKAQLQAHLDQPDAPVTGHAVGHHLYLKLPQAERHFWTPQLDVELEDLPTGGTLVRGLIGPTPAVWTRFVFLYAFSGFVVLFGMITGVPQWMLDKTPMGLWVMGLGTAMLGGVYLIAQSGKHIGAAQTAVLRTFWMDLVAEVAHEPNDAVPART